MLDQKTITKNEEILKTLVQWKVLRLRSFHNISNYSGKYCSFAALIKRLEQKKILTSRQGSERGVNKIIYPTADLIRVLGEDKGLNIDGETVWHDALASEVVHKMLQCSIFSNAQLAHEISHLSFDGTGPDAIVTGIKNNNSFRIAVELELTQKSRDRIYNKFADYCLTNHFNNAMYFFDKRSVYLSYIKRLSELKEENINLRDVIGSKLVFVLLRNTDAAEINLHDSEVFRCEKESTFAEIIKENEQQGSV